MPKQIDVKVTKPQNKHGQGKTQKRPIEFPSANIRMLCAKFCKKWAIGS